MQLSEWNRRVALDAVQAASAAIPIRATGNHLVAAQDEPEPDEAALLAGDLERNQRKAQRAHERNDRGALELQVQHMRDLEAL